MCLHWKVEPASFEMNLNVAFLFVVCAGGLRVIDVFGGV
jgi:hypothetical protein